MSRFTPKSIVNISCLIINFLPEVKITIGDSDSDGVDEQ